MKKAILTAVFLAATLAWVGSARAHCEIPCGIYNDEMRVNMLAEHIDTIEKSMKAIETLSKEGDKNYNQLVRWVDNKDHHAEQLQNIVTQYFMTQRLKPAEPSDGKVYERYVEQLNLLHRMLVHAMKAKQTTDLNHVKTLRDLLDRFRKAYFQEGHH